VTSKIAVTHPSLTDQVGKERQLPFLIEARPQSANTPLNELLDWMADTKAWREELLHRAGAILSRGFTAIRTAEDFAGVAQRIAPEILDYAGVTTPRSAVTGKIATSTDTPRHVVIGLRQEMSYLAPSQEFPDPTPDKVMFFCAIAPGRISWSRMGDSLTVHRGLSTQLCSRTNPGVRLHSTFSD
jgi:Taurine catabolism dioxygenase TauD, TfdA family